MKTMKTIMIVIVSLLLMTSCNNDDDNTPSLTPTNMVDAGDYNLYAESLGEGEHTLVFESGLGDNYEVWYELLGLSETNQVIAYNRAGYAPSEMANNDRHIIQLAEDLHQAILSKSQNDRVILVGHSLGGAVIRYYAIQHPEMVEALLFVDPSHEVYGMPSQDYEDGLVENLNNQGLFHVAKEAEQLIENLQILAQLPTLPDVPTIVLSSIRDREGEDALNWVNAHSTLGESVTDFTHITTENSGHYIQIEEPQLVYEAINALLN